MLDVIAMLLWCQTYSNLTDVLSSCYRRTLCYPLYRHWQLTQTIARDVHTLLTLGKLATTVLCIAWYILV